MDNIPTEHLDKYLRKAGMPIKAFHHANFTMQCLAAQREELTNTLSSLLDTLGDTFESEVGSNMCLKLLKQVEKTANLIATESYTNSERKGELS